MSGAEQRTREQRVHDMLTDADGQWVCSNRLSHWSVGGRRAAARIADLRLEHGYDYIDGAPCDCGSCLRVAAEARAAGVAHRPVHKYRIPARVDAEDAA